MAGRQSISLNVTYHSGVADGIISITQKRSPVHMYIIPRKLLKDAKEIDSIYDPGIYMLIKEDEERQIEDIYVGQTRNGLSRIFDHDRKKDWWNKVIMILGNSDTFNLDMISALEKYGIDKAYKSGYAVHNEVNPQYVIKSSLLNDVEWIFEETDFLLATQGYSLVKKRHRKPRAAKPAPVPEEPLSEAETDEPAPEPAQEPGKEPAPAEPAAPAPEAPAAEPAPEEPVQTKPEGTWISLDKEFSPTGYKMQAYSYAGRPYETESFRSFLKDIINLLYEGHSTVIDGIADGGHKLSGRIRRNQDFTRAGHIEGTDIYFEANWSAADTMRFVRELAEACGVSTADISVCVHSKSGTAEPLPAAEEPGPSYDVSMDGILHISTKEVTGLGTFNPETGELTVLEGSQLSFAHNKAYGKAKEYREDAAFCGYIREEDGFSVLKKAYTFDSPSGAGMFILGRSVNGWVEWKDANGVPLKELYPKE
ncbi:MAG: GIY-YIG nuclease family protein [Clostridia bacterium]|nr:GIY-YIG nuclease family protein [Clostridia bacterium]